jgi:DNA helicase-2/ATP-dependent DNA helicase PcrA
MDVQSALVEEQQRLSEALEEIVRQHSEIGARYYGDSFIEQVLDAKRQESRERLELLENEPYFGRLDFHEEKKPHAMPLYIGKRGMDRRDSDEPYIIDWRAPVASLFYSFTGGDEPVAYEAPEGVINGEVWQKRNIYIRDKLLQRVVDSYVRGGDNLGLTDEFLLYRLGEKKDNRLRDIVSTIQAEQDRIIRAPRNMALIIQGAAGSGKTTVALHRLAFLLYQYQGQIRAERMMILAPNTMFLDYISGVLPELGVGHVEQTTFIEWAMQLLGGQMKLSEQAEGAEWFSLHATRPVIDDHTSGRFKGSLQFKETMVRFLREYEQHYLQDIDYEPWDGQMLDKRLIRQWFDQEYGHYPLAARRERLIGRMKRWLDMQLAEIADPNKRKERSKTAKQRLQAYLKKHPEIVPMTIYRSLFEQSNEDDIPKGIARETKAYMKRGFVQAEDLAPLGWIHYSFHGADGQWFDHIVVDEAQDASPFQIALLNAYMREPSFTILGDLAQGIHSYRGVHLWKELTDVFTEGQTSYHELIQSYRSTLEIIEFANRILPHTRTGLPLAEPVFRSGEPVSVIELSRDEERIEQMRKFLESNRERGMQTFAIIGRTHEDCTWIYSVLSKVEEQITFITEGQNEYRGGVSVVPIFLAKGLEFDAVLLMDVDQERYTAAPQDAKMLYVGCTRALHYLTILYQGRISPLIELT